MLTSGSTGSGCPKKSELSRLSGIATASTACVRNCAERSVSRRARTSFSGSCESGVSSPPR